MASTVLDHVTAGLCLLSMYIYVYIYMYNYMYIHDILNSCCIWNVNLRFGFIFAWLTSTGPVIMVFGYFLMPRVFCALSVCILFGFFGAFGVFGVFGVVGVFGLFGVFVRFWCFRRCRLWGMEIYVLASPLPGSLFYRACDDGICVLCYAVCFLRPGYIIMRASGS